MIRCRYKILEEHHPYFITSSVIGKLPLFTDKKIKTIITDGLSFLIQKRKIKVYAYVIMPNHIHYNPVKAGQVANELDWRNSSAGFYSDKSSDLSLTFFGNWGAPTKSI